jgi:choline dehydrogenase-like flavoprotein
MVTAKREVIVLAGTFQSPQLLMVSGIGPQAILSQFKIPVIKELPAVGQRMEVSFARIILYKKIILIIDRTISLWA